MIKNSGQTGLKYDAGFDHQNELSLSHIRSKWVNNWVIVENKWIKNESKTKIGNWSW
jgi:hypothetical protein